ncbi:MAG: hypothetical protein KGI49_00360 [Patescibacteria group bacterium]|nr:hypothetical protein [Patescibacteria group bacterium]
MAPTDDFFVYYIETGEFGQTNGRFALVEVSGIEERILDYGEAHSITMNGAGYAHFVGVGTKVGRYEYYCKLNGWSGKSRFRPLGEIMASLDD